MILNVPVLLFIFCNALSARASLVPRQNGPDCIPTCFSTLYSDTCPDNTDAKCLCGQTHFGTDMYLCLNTFCDASDLDNAVQSVEGMCSNAAVPVILGPADSSTSSDAPSSTSSSDAPGQSTSTSTSKPPATSTSKTSSPTSASRTPTQTTPTPTPSKGGAAMSTSDKWAITWAIGVLAIAL
ncbi:hypothetical protein BJ165DRAFT_575708 [Panaeolus papilionaceus]|nr:hypothetical protein BJ165DRAFT_575708 [Panaeolus papilionaceus]